VNVVTVVEPGLLTTIQDLGRIGSLRLGIPPSGPLDRDAFLLANRLVGNPDSAAGLECTLTGPALEFQGEAAAAATGADVPVRLNGEDVPTWTAFRVRPGDVLKLGAARTGCRAYLAVSGGIDVPPVLSSRSTYLRGGLGGFAGRALQKGDRLPLGTSPASAADIEGRYVRPEWQPAYSPAIECRVILGPQADCFSPEAIRLFFESPYRVSPEADRMGYRLKGAAIPHLRGHDILSDGIPLGGIQVVGDGQPIILLMDRQSTGGYTKIATAISVDIPRIAQAKPDHLIRFREIGVKDAHALLRAHRAWLAEAIAPKGSGHGDRSQL